MFSRNVSSEKANVRPLTRPRLLLGRVFSFISTKRGKSFMIAEKMAVEECVSANYLT